MEEDLIATSSSMWGQTSGVFIGGKQLLGKAGRLGGAKVPAILSQSADQIGRYLRRCIMLSYGNMAARCFDWIASQIRHWFFKSSGSSTVQQAPSTDTSSPLLRRNSRTGLPAEEERNGNRKMEQYQGDGVGFG